LLLKGRAQYELVLPIAKLVPPLSSKKPCSFFGPTLIFPPRPYISPKKRAATSKKHNFATMTNPTTPPRSPDLVPHAVTQDSPLDWDNIHLLSFIPEAFVADGTAAAGTEETVTTSQCNDDCLKACIVAASMSVWGIQDIFSSTA
jgi:hypothetical protein